MISRSLDNLIVHKSISKIIELNLTIDPAKEFIIPIQLLGNMVMSIVLSGTMVSGILLLGVDLRSMTSTTSTEASCLNGVDDLRN